jgi:ABC-2 type transport system permease protein
VAAGSRPCRSPCPAERCSALGPNGAGNCFFVLHALAVALAGSEQRATLDVVLSAPIARRQYVVGWLVGLAVTLLGILAVLGIAMQGAAAVFGVDLAVSHTLAGVLNLWPLAVFAGGLAAVLCAVMPGSAGVTGAGAGVLVAMYFVEVLGRISETVGRVDVLSAFHYYGSAIEDGLDPGAFLGVTAAGIAPPPPGP